MSSEEKKIHIVGAAKENLKLVYLCIHGLQINFLLFLRIIIVIKIKFNLTMHDQPIISLIHVLG